MRFNEFRTIILEGNKGKQADDPSFPEPGYFTVGDSHSNGVGDYGRGKKWNALGMDGASATDSMHIKALKKIPEGSVIVISVGANDFKAGIPIPQIVSDVKKVIDLAKTRDSQLIYLLPTSTTGKDSKRREELRQALNTSIDIPIVDLGKAGPDGLHLAMPMYANIAAGIANDYKPRTTVKKLGTPSAEPGAPSVKDRIKLSTELEQGPPYPLSKKDEVTKMQTALQELGYNVGRPGADGKYGPFTASAVAAFKKDYNVPGKASKFGLAEFEVLSQINSGQLAKIKNPTRSNTKGIELDIPALTSVENVTKARKTAEEYLGRTMNDDEWKHLIQTITSESTSNPEEMAQIAGVILNRTRDKYRGKSTIVDIVWDPGQFQPVTGEFVNGKWTGPHPSFTRPANQERLAKIINAILLYLPDADTTYLNFTSANPDAYSSAAGRRFLKTMIAKGGIKIGGTVFGTV